MITKKSNHKNGHNNDNTDDNQSHDIKRFID